MAQIDDPFRVIARIAEPESYSERKTVGTADTAAEFFPGQQDLGILRVPRILWQRIHHVSRF